MILVGEMRDYETIETALLAAETGHLVLSTLHTLDATETINRIIAVFPPHQQKQIRIQLAAVLKSIISMRLLPRADGLGRVPAVEVLISTAYIRECIEQKEKTKLIGDAIASGTSQYGMQTFDQSLFMLYKSGLITLDEAIRRASNPDEFRLRIQGSSRPPTSPARRWRAPSKARRRTSLSLPGVPSSSAARKAPAREDSSQLTARSFPSPEACILGGWGSCRLSAGRVGGGELSAVSVGGGEL